MIKAKESLRQFNKQTHQIFDPIYISLKFPQSEVTFLAASSILSKFSITILHIKIFSSFYDQFQHFSMGI